MSVRHQELRLSTQGNGEMHDLTGGVRDCLRESGILDGTVTVFVPGATAGITTIEYEPGLIHDFPAAMERFATCDMTSLHD